MSEQWKAFNHLTKVMGNKKRKEGENSCTAAALKQHKAFKTSSQSGGDTLTCPRSKQKKVLMFGSPFRNGNGHQKV